MNIYYFGVLRVMRLDDIKGDIPVELHDVLLREGIGELRPSQQKAIDAGLLKGNNIIVCTPTASGKTLIAEIGMLNSIIKHNGKAVYVVPLKALASEKYHSFVKRYSHLVKIALSISDVDRVDSSLGNYDIIICTSEKLDALLRHRAQWLRNISVMVIDEIHLLNDVSRGPTLEVLITLIRMTVNPQIIGLSATIGNPNDLSGWLDAELVEDNWRPVKLRKGVYYDGKQYFWD
jgi:helicase